MRKILQTKKKKREITITKNNIKKLIPHKNKFKR